MNATYTTELATGAYRFKVSLTLSPDGMRCEWQPDIPINVVPREQMDPLRQAYRAWRDRCIGEFARDHGTTVLVVEV